MSIVKTISDLNTTLVKQQSKSNKIGLVPTMGSFNEGNLSLIRNAKNKCDFVWVTIFINPKQFNSLDDFNAYPKDIDNDVNKIFSISKHIKIFIPSTNEMYPDKKFDENYEFEQIGNVLEGKYRPGHFNGVAIIVKKLFDLFSPNMVFFGEKDFQQTLIIKRLISWYYPKIKIFVCPTIRNKDGLALSSRNQLISKKLLSKCKIIFETLQFAKANYEKTDFPILLEEIRKKIEILDEFKLEYFEIRDEEKLDLFCKGEKKSFRGFISVKVEGIRLIDNLLFKN